MPNLITHSLFAEEATDKMPESIRSFLKSRAHLVGIGANGPDFLFFQGLNPASFWKPARIRKYGGKLHHSHINDFYASALRSIRQEKDSQIRLDMEAYVCGHLCHWALDSSVHPYIFGRTGQGTKKSSFRHHAMESLIDAVMLKIHKGLTVQDYYFPAIADASREEKRAIARIYVPAIQSIFDDTIQPHLISDSLDDWYAMQKRFYDGDGKKKKVLYNMERLFGQENAASGLIIPSFIEDNWDILNLKHKRWIHPCDGTISSTESVLDMYEGAVDKAVSAMDLFLKAVDDPSFETEFLSYLDNRGYDTDMNTESPMVNFDIIDFRY